ncbi:helix-turn-helix transcriptional regulator [Kribbella qitaiheensis]|uniref:Helix-turn-helix transcriptional regulator n=1 Tax=Kribbella qitaiheensis TaxID=1544730 RepID=A0A7G6WUW1_9ACTN|nr:helix-turn-helix transcriptional regulator [Kribbella qitaiheensis]QNE17776.1 helix-turn-helix transcriptional regulator [Kribbella qitaiheensis]
MDTAHLGSVRRLREPERAAPEQLFRELLPGPVVDAYLDLLEQGARPMCEGDPADEELVSRHLCYLQFQPGPVLRAIDPLVAINGLLTEVHRELSIQQKRLLTGYAAAAELHDRQLRREAVPSLLVQVLTDADEIADRWMTSIHTARSSYRSISVGPLGSTRSGSGIAVHRQLCSPDLVADPQGAETIRIVIEAGGEVRTAQTLPLRMIVVDDHLAVVGLDPEGTTAALVVRSVVVVSALANFYDRLWAAATPVVLAGVASLSRSRRLVKQLGGTEREVLALLVHGLKDEAIARHLSLSVRTVRRHIATVMDFVDAPTRFAAGAAAQRLGLLG